LTRSLVAAAALVLSGCGGDPAPSVEPVGSPKPTAVEIRGLPGKDLRALSASTLGEREWQAIFRVTVGSGPGQSPPEPTLPMAGDYRVDGGVVRFTQMFGFDAGRGYDVHFDPTKIPGADPSEGWRQPVSQVIGIAAAERTITTTVRQIYPSGSELPENTLRFYIEFSGPMGRGEALPHIRLVDERGKAVVDPFLPVEAEFWSPDRTRFTLFFDPGRVKRGIKPNRDLGRALVAGRRYELVIDDTWLDGSGAPLTAAHRHEFTATTPIERALDPKTWTIAPPPGAGGRAPLTVTFPWALDHGLLNRALTVHGPAGPLAGEARIEAHETRWVFVPAEPWRAVEHTLEIAPHLEDPAGNRLGRAFEVMERVAEPSAPARVTFVVR
jgi:hypothetical protein